MALRMSQIERLSNDVADNRPPIHPQLLPTWVQVWLIASAVICGCDVLFTSMRPASLKGGSFEKFFLFQGCMAGFIQESGRFSTREYLIFRADICRS